VAKVAPIKILQKPVVAMTDYADLEKPTVIRQNARRDSRETRFGAQPSKDADLNYLDIPAFLRRQAD
jgi:cell division protein FtsZ